MNKKEGNMAETIVQPSGSKAYLVTAFVIAFMVMAVIPVWFVVGAVGGGDAHQHGGTTVPEEWFLGKLRAQQEKYGLPDGSVRMPVDSKVYVLAQQFAFTPRVIRVVFGGNYEFIFFSPDVLHGASLIQAGSVNIVILPDMTAKVAIKATQLGEIQLRCNEYCGEGHHLMKAQIIVE